MTTVFTATPQPRRAYDHHLREQVLRTDTRAPTRHLAIPRSTVSTWRPRGLRPVTTIEPIEQDRQQLLDLVAMLDRRARILAAVVRVLLALLRNSLRSTTPRCHTRPSMARRRTRCTSARLPTCPRSWQRPGSRRGRRVLRRTERCPATAALVSKPALPSRRFPRDSSIGCGRESTECPRTQLGEEGEADGVLAGHQGFRLSQAGSGLTRSPL
jgi:hypothetical protein